MGRRRNYVTARREACYQIRCQPRHGRPTAVESGRSRQPRLLSQLRNQKDARRLMVDQYPTDRTGRRALNRLQLRSWRRIWTLQVRASPVSRPNAQKQRLAETAEINVKDFKRLIFKQLTDQRSAFASDRQSDSFGRL